MSELTKVDRCRICGYSEEDAKLWGDHGMCKNAGNAPWEKPSPVPAVQTPEPDAKTWRWLAMNRFRERRSGNDRRVAPVVPVGETTTEQRVAERLGYRVRFVNNEQVCSIMCERVSDGCYWHPQPYQVQQLYNELVAAETKLAALALPATEKEN